MAKIGFKPKWTFLHDQSAAAFQKLYFEKDEKDIVSDHSDFMKWAYGKKPKCPDAIKTYNPILELALTHRLALTQKGNSLTNEQTF